MNEFAKLNDDIGKTRRSRAKLRYDEDFLEPQLYKDILDVPVNKTKWDESSMDSGFFSDVERKVAQLSISDNNVKPLDDVINIRAPSRAKLTEEEKRLKEKIRTLPSPGRSTRWHPQLHDDDVIDRDDNATSYRSTPKNSEGSRKSKSLPLRSDKSSDVINWDELTLNDVRQVGILGGGGYARVDLVELKRQPGRKLALKKMNKRLLQEREQVGHVISEKEAMKRARSRFIPRLFRTFRSPHHVFMLTEACLGGDLFSVLENHGALHIDAMRYVIGCVIEALDHLHRILNVIHRDVKTENILLDSNGNVKLADLGFCKRLPPNSNITNTFCGTPGYVAPEVLLRTGHGRTCDFFSSGVVLFEGATCRSPFRRHSSIDTHRATLRGIKEVAFPPFLDHVTIHFIRELCNPDPITRLGSGGCEELRCHHWFRGFDWQRLRQGKMASPLLNFTSPHNSNNNQSAISAKDEYRESVGDVIKLPYDVRWDENF